MNILLLFFALPIAVIIFSIVLQKILKCPILVAGVIFAIFLILSFTVFSVVFLVATIIYTLISFITATIVSLIERFKKCIRDRICPDESNHCTSNTSNTSNLLTIQSRCGGNENEYENGNSCGNSNGNLLTISSSCNNGENSNDLLTIQSNLNSANTSNNQSSSCNCNCTCRRNGTIAVNANVVPQNNTSGTFSGCYRRRCR